MKYPQLADTMYRDYVNKLKLEMRKLQEDINTEVSTALRFSTLDIKFNEVIKLRNLISAVEKCIEDENYNSTVMVKMVEGTLEIGDITNTKSLLDEAVELIKEFAATNLLKIPDPARAAGLAEEMVIEASEQCIPLTTVISTHKDQLMKALA
jgi:hypothetical protein